MRLSEIKLHDLEWIAAKTSVLYPESYEYPAKEINNLWENVLLCQFHDVLPGSCIEMVYKYEAIPMLHNVVKESTSLIDKTIKFLQSQSKADLVEMGTLTWSKPETVSEESSLDGSYTSSVTGYDDYIVLANGKLKAIICKKTGVITSITDETLGVEYLDTENGREQTGC